MNRFWLVMAAVLGLLSVALGAFGAHALKSVLDSYGRDIYEKAVHYQMFHTVALLAVGLLQNAHPQLSFSGPGWSFFFGIVLFSGSLYLLALTGAKWLGAFTPLGGLAFLIGWAWLALVLLRST